MMLLLPLLSLLWGSDGAEGQLWREKNAYRLQMQSPVTTQAGLSLHVPCKAVYPSNYWNDHDPAYGSWFRKGANVFKDPPVATNRPDRKVEEGTHGRFLLTGDLKTEICSLTINDVGMDDNGTYIFRVERGSMKYSYTSYELSVHVTDRPRNVTITIFQRRNGTEFISLGSESPLLVQEGEYLRLVCAARSHPPAQLSWSRGSLVLCPTQPSSSGVLELPQVRVGDEGEFTCHAQNMLGSQKISISLTLQRDAAASASTSGVVLGGIGGASTTVLLLLSFLLIFFIMRSQRKREPKPEVDTQDSGTVYENAASQGHQIKSWENSPPDPPPPRVATQSSPEEEDLNYASLSFNEKPLQLQVLEPTDCEYSEINRHK